MDVVFYTKDEKVRIRKDEWHSIPFRQLHRQNGPAIECEIEWWYQNGKRHRENGPAITYTTGEKKWYVDGKLHRLDGPAIERPDGYIEWWVNGIFLPKNKIKEWLKENDIDLKTEIGQLAFKMRWC